MSDHSAFGFGKFVPGFDFLQNLAQTASKATPAAGGIPGMSSWVAPTLSVEELEKRIQDLKAVHFWLEQNGTALKATIQALEVQKMTLSTLQSMNVNMADLAKAFTAKAPDTAETSATHTASPSPQAAPQAESEQTPPAAEAEAPEAKSPRKGKGKAAQTASVDPMAWWGSLTQQFQDIASAAMKDVAAEAIKAKASAPADAPAAAPRQRSAAKKSAPPASRKTPSRPAKTPRSSKRAS